MRTTLLRAGSLAGATAAVLAASGGVAVADDAVTTSAYGASATVSLLPGALAGGTGTTVDTGRLAASRSGGPASASAADVPLEGLVTAKAISSSVVTGAGSEAAKASVTEATLPLLAPAAGRVPSLRLISARCAAADGHVTGSSDLAGVALGRLGTLPAATAPNQRLGIPGVVEVIVNEQLQRYDGSLEVTALHIKLLGGGTTGALGRGDVKLASATCGPSRERAPEAPRQVTIVPAGAPQTGDGSLAAEA
ncbi:choice-of-anchor P family protein [Amycolatopsis sp. A133]|uniref:choice-of-anchor P family protein n=1 Tax=Amycolatopsis sp. A133 TaxID=3064472 RepID=UPI0027F5642F|nr:choice-of-anchor P family protein [Amycolatopsis sp. A133]MDQ7802986.1 choice-of-anchor P family protein [Amycolatopsis sp. A133]